MVQEKLGRGSQGWLGSRWAHPGDCSQGAVTRLGGCPGRGQGAKPAPGCPNPQERVWGPSPSSAPPQPPTPGAEEPRLAARMPVCPCGCGHESIQDWITPTSTGPPGPKPRRHPHCCCQPGPGAEAGVCGKCLGPWEQDGLQRDPQSRWSQTPWILPGPPTITTCFGWGQLCAPPIPVLGSAGTDTGLWGHVQGTHLGGCGDTVRGSGLLHWGHTVGPGGHQDRGDMQGVPRDVHWGCGDGHTPVPTGAPLPWQRPALKEKVENHRSSTPECCKGAQGWQEGQHHLPGSKPLPSPSSMDNPAELRSPSLYLCTKDVILPDSGQYSQLKANLCK